MYEYLSFEYHQCNAVCEHCGKRCNLREGHEGMHCHPLPTLSTDSPIFTCHSEPPSGLPPGVRETPYYAEAPDPYSCTAYPNKEPKWKSQKLE